MLTLTISLTRFLWHGPLIAISSDRKWSVGGEFSQTAENHHIMAGKNTRCLARDRLRH